MNNEDQPILNREQQLAFDFIKKGKNVVITGQAGTGKSLVINQVVKWLHQVYGKPIALNNTHSFYAITSMTGISSINLNGQTLHSWGGIGLGEGDVFRLVNLIDKRMKHPTWRMIKVLVIDEVSMMSMELFEKLHQIGCRIRGNSSQLFGGIQLVLCGDFLQLPPIGKGDAGRFCFESDLWKRHLKHTIYLTRIYRQQNIRFQEMLSRIRMGIVTPEDKALLSSRLVKKVPKMEIKPTKLYPFKRNVKEINENEYNKLIRNGHQVEEQLYLPLYLMELKSDDMRRGFGKGRLDAGRRMSTVEIHQLQVVLRQSSGRQVCDLLGKGPENQSVRICVGAQVMINYNIDVSSGLANGVKGIVRRFDVDGNPFLKIDGIDQEVLIMRANHFWETDRFKITIMQYPLELAWASTIHRSQSQSLTKVVTDLSCVFSRGQSYVCLSRVRSLEGLYLKAIDFKKIQCNEVAKDYYQSLGYWCEYQLVNNCRDWVCNSAYSGYNMDHPNICDLCLISYLTEKIHSGIPYEIWEIIIGYMNKS